LARNISENKISNLTFASRKEPEYMSHHMVICPDCDLVFADSPPTEDHLADAYHDAGYDSSIEAEDAARSYLGSIKVFLPSSLRVQGGDALEIGAGSGAFLQSLMDSGFNNVLGVEPSSEAIDAAPTHRQGWFVKGMFNEQTFQPESFDLVACFMTLEHVSDPMKITESVMRLLKPGGIFCSVTHDYRSPVNRLLGRKSPIVDIEHLQLFSKKSIRQMLLKSGFHIESIGHFSNTYRLSYWIRVSPLPKKIKEQLTRFLKKFKTADFSLRLNVGNTMSVARKPNLT
jgi:SAM-dependent methyltransferase